MRYVRLILREVGPAAVLSRKRRRYRDAQIQCGCSGVAELNLLCFGQR